MKVPTLLSTAALGVALAASSAAAQQLGNGVKLYGINYDRHKDVEGLPDWQRCKTVDDVYKDMEKLGTIAERVRLYAIDGDACDTTHILDAARGKIKVTMGIWPHDDAHFAVELGRLEALIKAGKIDDNITGIVVGSEAIYRKNYSADKAIDYLNRTRNLLRQYGKTNIKLTISDTLDSYYQNLQLIDAVDYVSVNQFSFWENADINEGMLIMLDRIRSIRMKAAAAGKEFVISETGWSSGGYEAGASVASIANQKKFFEDFYRQAIVHDLKYYWFIAFETDYKPQEVEKHFGVMSLDRQFRESFKNLNLTPPKRLTFKASSGKFLAETFNPNRIEEVTGIELIDASNEKFTNLRYQWFYDEAKGQIRSINSDRCLDAYQPWNGGIVHTYKCIETEGNQKWKYDATTKQLKHQTHAGFCLDNDPAQNYKLQLWGCSDNNANQQWATDISAPPATESTTVRLFAKESKNPKNAVQLARNGDNVKIASGAQGAAGSEWTYDSTTKLLRSKDSNKCLDAYEAWNGGRVHVWDCNPQEQNQRWNFDSSTGQFKHLKHSGYCLDGDQTGNVIQLWGCHLNNNNQVWRMVSSSAQTVQITNKDNSVVEFVGRYQQLLTAQANKDSQTWFWNSFKNTLQSKWGNECLDADNGAEGAAVHTWDCILGEKNQMWNFENGLIKHLKHTGKCLAYKNAADKSLVLKTCSNSDASQTFSLTKL